MPRRHKTGPDHHRQTADGQTLVSNRVKTFGIPVPSLLRDPNHVAAQNQIPIISLNLSTGNSQLIYHLVPFLLPVM